MCLDSFPFLTCCTLDLRKFRDKFNFQNCGVSESFGVPRPVVCACAVNQRKQLHTDLPHGHVSLRDRHRAAPAQAGQQHEHLQASRGHLPSRGNRHPPPQDLEDEIMRRHLRSLPGSVRAGFYYSLPGSVHELHLGV